MASLQREHRPVIKNRPKKNPPSLSTCGPHLCIWADRQTADRVRPSEIGQPNLSAQTPDRCIPDENPSVLTAGHQQVSCPGEGNLIDRPEMSAREVSQKGALGGTE